MSKKDTIKKMKNFFLGFIEKSSKEQNLAKMENVNEMIDEHNLTPVEALTEIEGIEVKEENIVYNSSLTIEKEEGDNKVTREEYQKIDSVVKQIGNDKFDELFAMNEIPPVELGEKIYDETCEKISGYVVEKNKEQLKEEEEEKTFVIEGIKLIRHEIRTGVQLSQTVTNSATPHLREYNNTPTFYKPVFSKAKTRENNLKKYLFMGISSVIAGIFGGVEANSYYLAVGGDVPNALACSWSWLPMFDTLTPTISPFYANVFFTGFGVWGCALGLVFLLSSMSDAERKASRVGHEHGNMRLATKSDFKKYIKKFMD